jgi:divalent metal cation (Fe/Co/Zn/Cd) transporter
VGSATSFERVHEISDEVAAAVRSVVPEADVVVHPEPLTRGEPDTITKVRMLAARHGLGAHGIRLYEQDSQRWLELHLEVSESLSLEQAHRQATEFEHDVRESMPGVTRIVSHLEPAGDITSVVQAEPADETQVKAALEEFFRSHHLDVKLHNIEVQRVAGELQVSFHFRLSPDTMIADAHDFTVRVEDFLRGRIEKLGRVVIHVEPK